MAEVFKTPGVYVVEKSTGANAVVQVETAVPVFIGYTEYADINGRSFHMKPVMISSMSEYRMFFGGPPKPVFTIKEAGDGDVADVNIGNTNYLIEQNDKSTFYLYYSLKFFYENGGADCYIISIGQYGSNVDTLEIKGDSFKEAIDLLNGEEMPTMLLMPDSLLLDEEDSSYYSVQTYALKHCADAKDKIALFDIWGGNKEIPLGEDKNKYINRFRENIGLDNLSYGVAYYPWMRTNIVTANDINHTNFDLESLRKVIAEKDQAKLDSIINAENDESRTIFNTGLKSSSNEYKLLCKLVAARIAILPVASALAGLYTRMDRSKGCWVAPANQNLNSVIEPMVKITHDDQKSLNVDGVGGKSINAIRAFKGRGSAIVWGARTLLGNSPEWRYINVRRLYIMIEQSIKNAAFAVIFQTNNALTWSVVKGTINNFMTNLWRQGALVGGSPGEAFTIGCGLGETMTQNDIEEGIMRINVKATPPRPAEFIEITFEQNMGQ